MIAAPLETAERLMTVEEFLALPDDDGVDRMLIKGRLLEAQVINRNKWHAMAEARIASLLDKWVSTLPKPRGRVLSGEAAFRLRGAPGTAVGIDVAYASREVISQGHANSRLIDGPPTLAVEILSPSDKQEEIIAKVREYLDVGVALVWIVEPEFQTVTVYCPGKLPRMFAGTEVLLGGESMPGFQIAVNDIFED